MRDIKIINITVYNTDPFGTTQLFSQKDQRSKFNLNIIAKIIILKKTS